MGGLPLLALSIAAFPEELPTEMLGEILAGADEVVRAAGAILAGGHTIRDAEPKYGLAVVGTVHPDGIWPKSGARPGDALFLTKPLGTGLVLQAQREGRAPDGALEAAVDADADAQPRCRRRAAAVRAERRHRRHRLRIARPRPTSWLRAAGCAPSRCRGVCRRCPARSSSPRRECARAETAATGSTPRRTSRATARRGREALAYDPQTAGGLLVSLPADKRAVLEADVRRPGACPVSGRQVDGRRRRGAFGGTAETRARRRTQRPPGRTRSSGLGARGFSSSRRDAVLRSGSSS